MDENRAKEVQEELVIERIFDAPRELVWQAWTEPERITCWWGPKGLNMQVVHMDFRLGGTFHYCLRSPGGHEMWGRFVYYEIAAPERMVFITSFSDAEGHLARHPMSATWPLEIKNILTLVEQAGKTTLTLRGRPYAATEDERITYLDNHAGILAGFSGTFDQLAEYLDREIKTLMA